MANSQQLKIKQKFLFRCGRRWLQQILWCTASPLVALGPLMVLSTLMALVPIAANASTDGTLDQYPGAELVDKKTDDTITSRRIILGPLKKIKNVLEPKSYQYLTGTHSASTYYIANERRVKNVVAFYRAQLQTSHEILFSCEGRDCGSSNYWANTVFETPILYGPEQYQSYTIAKALDANSYLTIYVGQRGTKKIYVQLEAIVGQQDPETAAPASAIDYLNRQGRYVISGDSFVLNESDLVEIKEFMDSNLQFELAIVVHDVLQIGEIVSDAIRRTERRSESIGAVMAGAGIDSDRLQSFGIGPLAPSASHSASRIELLVLNQALKPNAK
jgi:hypothetical protein